MQTKLIKIDADDPNKEDMREAAEIIRSGGLVAFPTREFDTLKSKKVPQSLEIGLFFCQIFIFII